MNSQKRYECAFVRQKIFKSCQLCVISEEWAEQKMNFYPFLLLWHETHQTEHRSDYLSWNLRFLLNIELATDPETTAQSHPGECPGAAPRAPRPWGALAISAKEKFPLRNHLSV